MVKIFLNLVLEISTTLVLILDLEILYCKTATADFLDFDFMNGVRINTYFGLNGRSEGCQIGERISPSVQSTKQSSFRRCHSQES